VEVTLINHATVLVKLDGLYFLTDPMFGFSVSFFLPRLQRVGIPLEELPPLESILVSHNHYDHLNLRSLRRLRGSKTEKLILASGDGPYARRTGFKTFWELKWHESVSLESVRITCVPAKHCSGRKWWDRNRSAYCGYVLEGREGTVYFAGDTAYDSHFRALSERFSVDIALLPIGAYKPYEWFKNIHLTPQGALKAFTDLNARHLVPIHWGTFKISDEPMSEPPRLLQEEAANLGLTARVHILKNGESFNPDAFPESS
jgi:L-ascorbate metabolism protein UlaG (beta-lactamase superfamily)